MFAELNETVAIQLGDGKYTTVVTKGKPGTGARRKWREGTTDEVKVGERREVRGTGQGSDGTGAKHGVGTNKGLACDAESVVAGVWATGSEEDGGWRLRKAAGAGKSLEQKGIQRGENIRGWAVYG